MKSGEKMWVAYVKLKFDFANYGNYSTQAVFFLKNASKNLKIFFLFLITMPNFSFRKVTHFLFYFQTNYLF